MPGLREILSLVQWIISTSAIRHQHNNYQGGVYSGLLLPCSPGPLSGPERGIVSRNLGTIRWRLNLGVWFEETAPR